LPDDDDDDAQVKIYFGEKLMDIYVFFLRMIDVYVKIYFYSFIMYPLI